MTSSPADMNVLDIVTDVRILLACFASLLCVYVWFTSRSRNRPPGPWAFPLVGCLPSLVYTGYKTGISQPHILLTHLTKQYGNIYSLYLGNKLVIVLSSPTLIREAFRHKHVCDRPYPDVFKKVQVGIGLTISSGKTWWEQRKFTLRTFNKFGIGKTSFEDRVSEEAKHMINEFKEYTGLQFDPKTTLLNASCNVLCNVVLGRRFDYDNETFQSVVNIPNRLAELMQTQLATFFLPILKYLQPHGEEEFIKVSGEGLTLFQSIVGEHKASFDPDNLTDYVDVYLHEIQLSKENNTEAYINEDNLIASLAGFFGAGTESISSTIRWCILCMIAYPDIQLRVQQEIDAVVGRNRLPKMSDKEKLTFTFATILEAQRLHSISPIGFPRQTSDTITLQGFEIPPNAIIISNTWKIEHDPNLWHEPLKFNPDRFIDDNDALRIPDCFMPFGTGQRICVAETLSNMELFIFFSYLMHQLTFRNPDNTPPPCLDGEAGIDRNLDAFEIVPTLRD